MPPPLPSPPPLPPLAERLRPQDWREVVGQKNLLSPQGGLLHAMLSAGTRRSLILWGPPGVGKTSLARLIARSWGAEVLEFSGARAQIRDLRDAVDAWFAQHGLATPHQKPQPAAASDDLFGRHPREPMPESKAPTQPLAVFVDEIHRFNKAQQDYFLPWVEQGLFYLIGATTENPGFEINNALLSRCALLVLEPLDGEALHTLLMRALKTLDRPDDFLSRAAQEALIHHADGDARRLLGDIEVLVPTFSDNARNINPEEINSRLAKAQRRFDHRGDGFLDQISALHKSVRGSDINASLYWFCRMLDGGCDPLYIARRMLRMAVEDIGLADPNALTQTLSATQTYERLGSPEGELALAQALIYLAALPKSNAVYTAFKSAKEFVANDRTREVPYHLRNAPTRVQKDLGMGKDYRYAHDEPNAYAALARYFPEGVSAQTWYRPTERGLEKRIAERIAQLAKWDEEAKANKKKD